MLFYIRKTSPQKSQGKDHDLAIQFEQAGEGGEVALVSFLPTKPVTRKTSAVSSSAVDSIDVDGEPSGDSALVLHVPLALIPLSKVGV